MSRSGRPAGGLLPAVVLLLGAAYLALLLPSIARSYPSDDTLLLVPTLVAQVEGRSLWDAVVYVLAPNQPAIPRAAWKAYVLLTLWLMGPTHVGLVWTGLALHVASSVLVWLLARRLGMQAGAAWIALGLHLTAYAGFHAYLWPVGVQHVLTILGVLALFNLYLATDQRWRTGRPYRTLFWMTAGMALLSSLSRASSIVGPVTILAHAILSPGDARQRLDRYDLWRLPVFFSLVYPIALTAYGNDIETLGGFPPVADALRFVLWRVGPAAAFASMLAGTFALLLLTRAWMSRSGAGGSEVTAGRPSWRLRGLQAAGVVLAAPAGLKLALVYVWGVALFLAPLGPALDSDSTQRWHVATLPVDLIAVVVGAIVLFFFLREHARRSDALVLLVPLGAFALALHAASPQPIRYWIYVTPTLAIVLGGAAVAARRRLTDAFPSADRWGDAALAAVCGIAMLTNAAAVRLELWRHTMADSYQILDYLRTADLIRQDLDRLRPGPRARICVDGLERLPHEERWVSLFAPGVAFRDYNARSILSQALGRDARFIGLDCGRSPEPIAYRYTVQGPAVLRDGQSIDPFDRAQAALRTLVAARDYRAASELIRAPLPRPFVIRHLLQDLPDDDVSWATNGASLLVWLERVSANHDHWYGGADPKIRALRALAEGEVISYVRLLLLAEHVHAHDAAAAGMFRAAKLPFGGLALPDVERLVQSDPVLSIVPDTPVLLEGLGQPRTTPDPTLFAFLGRLLWSGFRLPPGTP